jgi:hypothetical protein
LPLLGSLSDAADIVTNEKIDDLYVALPLEEHMKLLDLVESTSREGVDVKVVPDLLQFIALRARLEDLDGVPVINLNDVPLQGVSAVIKRALDFVISAGALGVMALPGLLISWMIKKSSPGPIFYAQERMGLDGKQFTGLQVPDHADRCGERDRPDLGRRERQSRDQGRRVPAASRPRRVAPVLERAEGRHVDRWSAAGAAVLRRTVQAPHPAVHVAPQGQGRITGWAQVNGWRGNTSLESASMYDLYTSRTGRCTARHQDHVADADAALCANRGGGLRLSSDMPAVVITGAAGFNRFAFAETLLVRGFTVVASTTC